MLDRIAQAHDRYARRRKTRPPQTQRGGAVRECLQRIAYFSPVDVLIAP